MFAFQFWQVLADIFQTHQHLHCWVVIIWHIDHIQMEFTAFLSSTLIFSTDFVFNSRNLSKKASSCLSKSFISNFPLLSSNSFNTCSLILILNSGYSLSSKYMLWHSSVVDESGATILIIPYSIPILYILGLFITMLMLFGDIVFHSGYTSKFFNVDIIEV